MRRIGRGKKMIKVYYTRKNFQLKKNPPDKIIMNQTFINHLICGTLLW